MLAPHGRRLFLSLLAALALLAAIPALATPASQIVLFGAPSGTHLTVSTSGDKLVVDGQMADVAPIGCHLAADRGRAVCSLARASVIEIDLGQSGDFVEVVDPLPVSLIAHMGSGSDKFIGNAEQDTCYSEGSRRNRCIGRGGDDTCITGRKNSDCVGGGGEDYCRTGAGSDGCWGGPGNDICFMGPGEDGCHGEAGNDFLYGGADPDQLYGGPGIDYCDGGPGLGKSHTCETGPGS